MRRPAAVPQPAIAPPFDPSPDSGGDVHTVLPPEQVIPASEAQIIPAHTEEITEWVCSESALMDDSAPLPSVSKTAELEAMEMPF